jgi:hypothetical protein
MKMDINTRYTKNTEEIEQKIKLLKEKLKKHKKGFKNNPTNWGYVGDLSYINEKLNEIHCFLS